MSVNAYVRTSSRQPRHLSFCIILIYWNRSVDMTSSSSLTMSLLCLRRHSWLPLMSSILHYFLRQWKIVRPDHKRRKWIQSLWWHFNAQLSPLLVRIRLQKVFRFLSVPVPGARCPHRLFSFCKISFPTTNYQTVCPWRMTGQTIAIAIAIVLALLYWNLSKLSAAPFHYVCDRAEIEFQWDPEE
jgi:hypothetical protein